MAQRESTLRSVLFLVVGALLVFSLIVCIFIFLGEKDLVKTEATVIKVLKDAKGTDTHNITVTYDVNGILYEYTLNYKEDVNVDDKIVVYYHGDNVTTVQTFKTTKLIFICPIIGLVLCALGLYELFKKPTEGDEFKTTTIEVINPIEKKKEIEAPVKEEKEEPKVEKEVVKSVKIIEEVPEATVSEEPVVKSVIKEEIEEKAPKKEEPKEEVVIKNVENVEVKPVEEKVVEEPVLPKQVEEKKEEKPASSMEDAIMKKVQDSMDNTNKVEVDEDDLKKVIKDMLKEVIQEVQEEKEPPKKVEQKRVLPNYYYISGTSLIYEEPGKDAKEISLKTVKSVVRTVNSEGNVVKLIVSNDETKCVLTNMKNIDLEQVASLLNNKMRTIDENFKEEIEYKEY